MKIHDVIDTIRGLHGAFGVNQMITILDNMDVEFTKLQLTKVTKAP
jgi:hypothetical protein